jgi:tetraacyldisaccharide 4'-kinase
VVHRAGVPVVSVGNLTLGGTGKTPMVQWLARWFRDSGVAVSVVSRGYGGGPDVPNDEAMELAWQLPDVPHVQNPDRVAAARRAIDKFHAELILLDDAFQHRRISRDLDLVLLDALEPFGYEHVFPRGTLREPAAGLARADVVALSRADMLSAAERGAIRRRVEALAPQADWLELVHVPQGLLSFGRTEQPLASLAGQPVLAFCGIGNPAGFRHTLAGCGFEVIELREFPDHHAYDRRDLDALAEAAGRHGVTAVVCTQKDLVKIGLDQLGDRPLRAVRIGLEIVAGREEFEARLAAVW